MDLKAAAVLADAKEAVTRFNVAQNGQDRRLYWFAAIGLLRAVGHVLDKVDGKANPAFRERQNAWWDQAKHEPMGVFLEHTRSMLLKQYLPLAQPAEITTEDGEPLVTENGATLVTEQWYLTDGPFEGREAGSVIHEALAWWERQLTSLVG